MYSYLKCFESLISVGEYPIGRRDCKITAKNIGNDIISKLNRSKPDRYTFIDIPFRYRAHGMNCLPENAILAADVIYDNQMVDADHWDAIVCVRARGL